MKLFKKNENKKTTKLPMTGKVKKSFRYYLSLIHISLNIELNLNEKDTSVMDTEPEQAEEQPERKCAKMCIRDSPP